MCQANKQSEYRQFKLNTKRTYQIVFCVVFSPHKAWEEYGCYIIDSFFVIFLLSLAIFFQKIINRQSKILRA